MQCTIYDGFSNSQKLLKLDSPMCDPQVWTLLDVDELANFYDTSINHIIDKLIPVRYARCPRLSKMSKTLMRAAWNN